MVDHAQLDRSVLLVAQIPQELGRAGLIVEHVEVRHHHPHPLPRRRWDAHQCQIHLGRAYGAKVLHLKTESAHVHVSHVTEPRGEDTWKRHTSPTFTRATSSEISCIRSHPLERGDARNAPDRSASSVLLELSGDQTVQGSLWTCGTHTARTYSASGHLGRGARRAMNRWPRLAC